MSWLACYSAPTPPEAHVVKGFLEGRGVPCLLRAEGSSVYPSTAFGSRVHVLVPEDWLPVAKKMVERQRRGEPARGGPPPPRGRGRGTRPRGPREPPPTRAERPAARPPRPAPGGERRAH